MAGDRSARPVALRLRPLYATAFIHGFVLWYSVEKLFMRSLGLNDYLITIATLVYIVVMMMANIPLGVLADRWSRKAVLCLATCALIASSVICGVSHGLATYAAGISAWGIYYAAYAGTYDSVIYDVVLEETGSADGYERFYGRVQMFDSLAFIVSALLSACVAHYTSLRVEYFLTIPFTCCAFFTLRRFREPSLHRRAPKAGLPAHLGQVLRGAAKPGAAWIVVALVANCVALRLLIEFCQLWYLGLALPVVWYGPSCALLHSGAWGGGALADRLRSGRTVAVTGFCTLAAAGGLFIPDPALVVASQVTAITGITVLTIVLTRHLHEVMPSHIRAGASSVVSTIGYAVFVPAALGLGLVSRAHGIFEASVFVAAPLAIMFVAVFRARRWARPSQTQEAQCEPLPACQHTEPRLTSRHTEPRLTSQHTEPRLTSQHTEPRLTSQHTEPRLTGQHTEPRLTGQHSGPGPVLYPPAAFGDNSPRRGGRRRRRADQGRQAHVSYVR